MAVMMLFVGSCFYPPAVYPTVFLARVIFDAEKHKRRDVHAGRGEGST